MDHNPKKSKALIITIIAIVLLLLVGYLLFINSEKIFGVKNSSSLSKVFSPLLGTSKPKALNTKDTTGTGTGNTNTTTGTGGNTNTNTGNTGNGGVVGVNTGANTGNGGMTGVGTGGSLVIPPPFNPIPTPDTNCRDASGNAVSCNVDTTPSSTSTIQCADNIDNDGDSLVDAADPGCHTDYNASNNLSYDRTLNSESRTNPQAGTGVQALCPDDPLVFTTAEKDQLAVLLRQYYLLAPTLRIDDDVTLLDYDNQTNSELIKQASQLITDCSAQKANPAYLGPREIKDNPYYQTSTPANNTLEYIPGYSTYELLFNIW